MSDGKVLGKARERARVVVLTQLRLEAAAYVAAAYPPAAMERESFIALAGFAFDDLTKRLAQVERELELIGAADAASEPAEPKP